MKFIEKLETLNYFDESLFDLIESYKDVLFEYAQDEENEETGISNNACWDEYRNLEKFHSENFITSIARKLEVELSNIVEETSYKDIVIHINIGNKKINLSEYFKLLFNWHNFLKHGKYRNNIHVQINTINIKMLYDTSYIPGKKALNFEINHLMEMYHHYFEKDHFNLVNFDIEKICSYKFSREKIENNTVEFSKLIYNILKVLITLIVKNEKNIEVFKKEYKLIKV